MALAVHESSLCMKTEASDAHAALRCAECDPDNICWHRCDSLIEEQSKLNLNITNFTKSLKPLSIED